MTILAPQERMTDNGPAPDRDDRQRPALLETGSVSDELQERFVS